MNDMMDSRIREVKQTLSLKAYADARLERCGKTYVCPACGSGRGKNHTPAFSIDPSGRRWKCFSCGAGGDVIDLAQTIGGGSVSDAIAELEQFAGIDAPATTTDTGRAPVKKNDAPTANYDKGRRVEAERLEAARKAMTEGCPGANYLMGRGFTFGDIKRFGIGWDAERGCVMLPFGELAPWYHVDRFVSPTGNMRHGKPSTAAVGPQPAYRAEVLQGGAESVVFVVEAALDALAVEACGHEAVALCSTSSTATVRAVRESGFEGVLVLMLDNDEAGTEGADRMARDLDGFRLYRAERAEWKDACEALEYDRAGLASYLSEQETKARLAFTSAQETREQTNGTKPRPTLQVMNPIDVAGDIFLLADAETPTPTGLKCLDAALGGGLRSGLYVIGAISSFGKTTLMAQLADQIAKEGHPVLFITIEQSASELVTKSLTRLMHMRGARVNAQEVNDPDARAGWDSRTEQAFKDACEEYGSVAANLRIAQANRQPTALDLEAVAEGMRAEMGEPPIVFLDYLQLVKSDNEHDSDKQAVDKAVMAMRQLARDLKTPVFVTSSLNRSSYSGSITLDSFKESGAVEYGSDVLIGLQPADLNSDLKGMPEHKAKDAAARRYGESRSQAVRKLELVILKNRNGRLPDEAVPVLFDAQACRFYDGATPALAAEASGGRSSRGVIPKR